MKIKRNIVTPYLAFLFLAVGVSGIFMFFHVFDGYTKVVHEILGLAFVVFSVLHLIINWKSMKSHFKKRVFIFSGIIVLIFSIAFIMMGKMHKNHAQKQQHPHWKLRNDGRNMYEESNVAEKNNNFAW